MKVMMVIADLGKERLMDGRTCYLQDPKAIPMGGHLKSSGWTRARSLEEKGSPWSSDRSRHDLKAL